MIALIRPAIAALVVLAAGAELPAQAGLSRAQMAELEARAQLDSGKFAASRATYAAMLGVSRTKRDSAASLFGTAFAEQQTLESDTLAWARATQLIRQYRRAQTLDAARFRVAAQSNIALLFSAAGRHDSAARAYVRAAELNSSEQGRLLLEAAREYRLAGSRGPALETAHRAATDSAVAAEAVGLIVELYHETEQRRQLVHLADTLQSATAPLARINDALAAMMRSPQWMATPWGERCLIVLARNYAILDIGPLHFAETERDDVERAAKANEGNSIGTAIEALLDAYRVRDTAQTLADHPGHLWWMSPTPGNERRAVWSTTLRRLGDWHARANAAKLAISFYEAALGGPAMPVDQEWVDLEALPPLPALYAMLPDTGALWDRLLKVEALTNRLFHAKSAMEPDNMRRLRLVRLTLGHLFAQKGQWDNGWYGAIRQLEESRRLATQIGGESVSFPAEVYELLFAEYARRGCRAEALSVGQDLRTEYERRDALADRDRVVAAMAALPQPAVPPLGCRGT